jgi:hypothetical protein
MNALLMKITVVSAFRIVDTLTRRGGFVKEIVRVDKIDYRVSKSTGQQDSEQNDDQPEQTHH